MPTSGRKRPPRSKMRRTLPGWVISKRGSGSRNGTHALLLRSPPRSAAARSAAAAARRSCCSFRRSAAGLSGNAPLLYRAAPHSMQPCVIMLLRFCSTSFGWQPAVPQLRWATRRSPGLTKRMNSGDFVIEQGVGADRVGRRRPGFGEAWGDVGRFLGRRRRDRRRGSRCSRGARSP